MQPSPVGRCGSGAVLHGPFLASHRGFRTFPINGATINNGRLILQSGSQTSFVGAVDLSDSSVEIAVDDVPDKPGLGTRVRLIEAGTVDRSSTEFFIANRTLTAKVVTIGSSTPGPKKTVPYDAAMHRILRFREHANTLRLEASANRAQWTELLSVPSPQWVHYVLLDMELEKKASAVGQVTFSELNEGVPLASWCPAASRREDFTADASNAAWYRGPFPPSSSRCSIKVIGGDMVFSQQALGTLSVGSCGAFLSSKPNYDLRNGVVEIGIKSITAYGPGWNPRLLLNSAYGPIFDLFFRDNQMCASGTAASCVPYNGEQHWRFVHNGTALAWQVSQDRTAWVTLRSEPVSDDDLVSVHVYFGVGDSNADKPLEFRVTDYNPP